MTSFQNLGFRVFGAENNFRIFFSEETFFSVFFLIRNFELVFFAPIKRLNVIDLREAIVCVRVCACVCVGASMCVSVS